MGSRAYFHHLAHLLLSNSRAKIQPIDMRVLIWGVSQMLRDVISSIVTGEPNLEVITLDDTDVELAVAIKWQNPDVIIMGDLNDQFEDVCADFLLAPVIPRKIVAIAQDEKSASVYNLERMLIEELSTERLLTAIRDRPIANH